MLCDVGGVSSGCEPCVGSFNEAVPASTLSANEQMYFLKAPLAHVVAYEEQLRAERLCKVYGRGLPMHYKERLDSSLDAILPDAAEGFPILRLQAA